MKKLQRYEAYTKVCDDGRIIIEYIPTYNGKVYLVDDIKDAVMSEIYSIFEKETKNDRRNL